MVLHDKIVIPERKETDESLRTERQKADEALMGDKKTVEDDADLLVLLARENADAVLTVARKKADEKLHTKTHPAPSISIVHERVLEDKVLQLERDLADENVDNERKEVNQALRKLLPLEREATDRTLITERARSDTTLENRDDFLGMVCHDLRDLLNGIVQSTELLTFQEVAHGEAKRVSVSVLQIQRYAARMNRLIGDLVDVASIDSGKLSIVPLRQDATFLITEARDTFRAIAAAKDITLEVEGVQGPLFAYFDHDRMLQVFANLITNSIKFTTRGGKIILYCEKKETDLLFTVSDTGLGIPEEMYEAIFERFWQVGKNDHRGLGLGL